MMRIGMDAKWYFNGPAGVRTVVRNLIDHLARLDNDNEYIIYLNRDDDPLAVKYSAPNFATKTLWPSQSWLRVLLQFSYVSRRDRLDILCTHNFCPIWCTCKRVVIIYDTIFETHPQFFTQLERLFFAPVRFAARYADKVITVSEYCKYVITTTYGISSDKIAAVLLGCTGDFRIPSGPGLRSAIQRKYLLPTKYVLYVGRLNIRKNLPRLIEAFSGIEDKEASLVVVGAEDWKNSDLAPLVRASSARDRIVFLGHVPDEDLSTIYQLATVFVYVPLVEGFGLPPLEAMASGVPVITSNTSSLPEVVGECAVVVDPTSVEDIRTACDNFLGSAQLREQYIVNGIRRAESLNWSVTARNILEVFNGLRPNSNVENSAIGR